MSEKGPREQALLQLSETMRSAIEDAQPYLTPEELTQAIESILRAYFMARVYPR